MSVRNRLEYQSAIVAGIDIIDFKEPANGPLAPVAPAVIQEVVGVHHSDPNGVGQRAVLSAALGERDTCESAAKCLPSGVAYAKVGPSGCQTTKQLANVWRCVGERLPEHCELVGVAYADHASADCIDPLSVLALAASEGMRRCLIDTFCKDGRSTVDCLGIDGLKQFATAARQLGLWWALAGSVTIPTLQRVFAAGVRPNCVGVRGAVCHHGRASEVSVARVNLFRQTLWHLDNDPVGCPSTDGSLPVDVCD